MMHVRRNAACLIALLIVLATLGSCTTWSADASPPSRVRVAAADLASWPGMRYRALAVDPDGPTTTADVEVAADGTLHGVLTREPGARAELAVTAAGETFFRGNEQWWLHERPGAAGPLADRWLREVSRSEAGVPPIADLVPEALADRIDPATGPWTDDGETTVDGRPGYVLTGGEDRFVVLDAARPERVLAAGLTTARTALRAHVVGEPGEDGSWIGKWRWTFSRFAPLDDEQTAALRAAAGAITASARAEAAWYEDLADTSGELSAEKVQALAGCGYDPRAITPLGPMSDAVAEVILELDRALTKDPKFPSRAKRHERMGTLLTDIAETRTFPMFHILSTHPNFMSRDSLPKLVVHVEQAGQRVSLENATRDVVAGDRVEVEAPLGTGEDASDVDVLNHTRKTLIQDKNITAGNRSTVMDEIKLAIEQCLRTATELDPRRTALGREHSARGAALPDLSDYTIVIRLRFSGPKHASKDRAAILGLLADFPVRLPERLLAADGGPQLDRHGRPVVGRIVVQTFAGTGPDSPTLAEFSGTPAELFGDGPGSGGTPTEPGPTPGDTGPAPGGTADSPARAAPFGGPDQRGTARGPLAQQLSAPAGAPGGIDLTSLTLRYLSDGTGGGTRYAFSAKAGSGPSGSGPSGSGSSGPADPSAAAERASDAFFVWLALPRSAFWVNLNPDQPDTITDPELGRTDVGRTLLEADLRLKQSVTRLTNPTTPSGSAFWRSRGGADILRYCGTMRAWIVPGQARIREDGDAVHIVDAPLVVKAESMRVDAGLAPCTPPPPEAVARQEKALRTHVLPLVETQVATAPEFAELRQVYYARVAAEWYRQRSATRPTGFADLIDSSSAAAWHSTEPWSPREVFDRYRRSFTAGEYPPTPVDSGGERWMVTMGGIDMSAVPLVAEQHPGTASPDLAGTAFTEPVRDPDGTIWLGAVTTGS